MAVNPISLPNALIEKEIANLKHELFHRLFGSKHTANEKIPDFPRNLFEQKATQTVHLSLLLSAYINKHSLVVDDERVEAMIDKLAMAYEKPDELRSWYKQKKERMEEINSMVLEELVAEKISEHAQLIEKIFLMPRSWR